MFFVTEGFAYVKAKGREFTVPDQKVIQEDGVTIPAALRLSPFIPVVSASSLIVSLFPV